MGNKRINCNEETKSNLPGKKIRVGACSSSIFVPNQSRANIPPSASVTFSLPNKKSKTKRGG